MAEMNKKHQINIWYALIAVGLMLIFQSWYATWKMVETIPYSEFEQYLEDGRIAEVEVRDQQLYGKFTEPQEDGRTHFITNRVDPEIAEQLNISIHTVKNHRKNMLRKAGCKNSGQLITRCLLLGII